MEKRLLMVLSEIEKAISESNIDGFKKFSNSIDFGNADYQITLKDYYENTNNPIRNTNLVILSSKHNQVQILEYLFSSDSKILYKLSVGIGRPTILPDDEDETCHNAFYYAIRSGNVKLIDILINKWPNNYFDDHLEKLDDILSKAYEELKLKNVPLSDEMEIFVEKKLIKLRFYSNASRNDVSFRGDLNNIRERIELILENINLLKNNYSNTEEVDEKFLFVAKFIAQNIHTLKRKLKSSYIRLPWEEIEFFLVCFVSSHTQWKEINVFYRAALDKRKLLNHLKNFGKKLEDEKNIMKGMNIRELSHLPKLNREKVVAEIISSHRPFEELYKDYRQIKDIHSLEKISVHIKLALSADPKERDGQLIITRVLQVIGEYLKTTLESPNLSKTASELFLLSLPKNARTIIVDLRNSLSHAYSLSKRLEIEENKGVNFFINIQNDTKKVCDVVTDILCKNKIEIIRMLLTKIIKSENLNETIEVIEVFRTVEIDKMIPENFKMLEHQKLANLVQELRDTIPEKTDYENALLKEMNSIISAAGTPSENIKFEYITGLASLKAVSSGFTDNKIDHTVIKAIKFRAKLVLKIMTPKIEPHNLKEIAQLSRILSNSVQSRIIPHAQLDKINRAVHEIFYIVEFGTDDIKWLEEFRAKLNEKDSFIPHHKPRKSDNVSEEKCNDLLVRKLSELKSILSKNFSSESLIENLSSYKSDKKLQAVVEMLVLDIMSILDTSKNYLENNLLCLDDNAPLLIGKCLRNHLAHDNTLVDVLLADHPRTIILNAIMLAKENIMSSNKKLGKMVSNDTLKLREKYDQSLDTIADQKRMFVALEEGNRKILNSCLKKGSDIYARSINSWTSLHYAAKGPSLEVFKFILSQNLDVNAKDINDQTPLHIAAVHGRQNIVEYFVKETGLYIDELNNTGKTPLHVAAQHGHKDTVEVLLKNKANTVVQDMGGYSPLHYAIINNHVDVAQILLEKDVDVNINQAMGEFTPLHAASESGHLEIVNFLLQNKADVNAKDERNWTPLHAAAYNGYRKIVNALILKGADVNARVINGCTPLYYAVENGDEKIVNILLNHEANVNAVEKSHTFTPLHYATRNGQEEIVTALLKNKAKTNVATVDGITPLHFAVIGGNLKIVDILLKHGVDIHAKDKNNLAPLHYGADNGHREVVELLLKNGAIINAADHNELTPLHLTAFKGHKDVIDVLIKNKALVNVQNVKGETPLHAAAVNGNKDIIDLLIKNNAEVNSKNGVGVTPLHVAAVNGNKDIIDLLIKHNAGVNAKNGVGMTPLHVAARTGNGDAITLLIKYKAEVNARADHGFTPLHAAVVGDHKDVVNILIKNKAVIDAGGFKDGTPLHVAVEGGFKEIVEILVANGANVNVMSSNVTPLLSAIKCNHKEIVEVLIANGAQVNIECNKPLSVAIHAGFRDIVEILLKHTADINMKGPRNITQLHIAAKGGHKEIVNALIARGADIDSIININETPLSYGAMEGHEEVVEILLAAGAKVNGNGDFTPLHMAAANGHSNVVKVLLDNKAKVDVKDNKNRTPLEMAVAYGCLEVVKMFLQYKNVDMEVKGNDGWTILHIASQGSNLELVKYLVDEGSDINARNASGSKSIHIAAREGHKDNVEFFLSNGLRINDLGAGKQSLLHYAAMKGHLEVAKYLIAQGADVNAKDANGQTPIYMAAIFGYNNITELLLKHGAVYSNVDKFSKGPAEYSNDKEFINQLSSTAKLFKVVKCNNPSEVENCIKAGGFVNAKNSESVTPLHYAAWKGYEEIVNILLQNKANPSAVGKQGLTPLHYAAKFSHSKIIKVLLSNYAVYNAISDCGKTPLDFSVDKSITTLLNLVGESFKNVKNNHSQVVHDLNKINDIDTIKAIMNARNTENKTLIVAAMQNNFSKIQKLKEIAQGDIASQINRGSILLNQGNYQMALCVYQNAFEKRNEILGSDNPATLDILSCIAYVLYAQGAYQKAINTYEEIFQKQKETLGLNYKDTLITRSSIALVLHRQGKDEEALSIYQEVYQKQNEILGPNDSETLDTHFHMALVLNRLGKYEEALDINRAVYEKLKKKLGANDPSVVRAQNNIALVLASQGNYEEALKIYKEVLEKKKVVLGINHSDTLRTLHNIAGILGNQKKYHEAVKAHEEILNIQESVLGVNHPDTLTTRYNMGNVLFAQNKWIGALKAYRASYDQMKAVFGPTHSSVLGILEKLKELDLIFKVQGTETSEILQNLQKGINIAANNGDVQAVQHLLNLGIDANDRDIDGRTALHFAVSNGHIGVINILLKNGVDIAQATNKGNTPLHTATSKGSAEIVEILLQHVSCNTLNNFINATTVSSGATSLHVAVKNGSLDITKSLLKRGAIYDIKNNEGKTPLDLCKEQEVNNLLRLLEDLFEDAKNGNIKNIETLRSGVTPDEFIVITKARNNQGHTILQVAIANKHKNIANKLLEMIKMSDQNLQKSL